MELLLELYKLAKPSIFEAEEKEPDLWHPGNTEKQEISSAKTSRNQVPGTFKAVQSKNGWEKGSTNADIGGGKEFMNKETQELTHLFTSALKSAGVVNVVYDPFNRTISQNAQAASAIRDGQSDTVTVNNVLNVIQDHGHREIVYRQADNALKSGGTAYFYIYEGDGSGEGRQTTDGWQNNKKAAEYMSEIASHFRHVSKKGQMIVATGPKSKKQETPDAIM